MKKVVKRIGNSLVLLFSWIAKGFVATVGAVFAITVLDIIFVELGLI